jgi:hypothetical protein
MHHSRLCAVLIDCNTSDVDASASFWSQALGRAVDPDHPGTRGNYRMLDTPPDELIVQIQRVSHVLRGTRTASGFSEKCESLGLGLRSTPPLMPLPGPPSCPPAATPRAGPFLQSQRIEATNNSASSIRRSAFSLSMVLLSNSALSNISIIFCAIALRASVSCASLASSLV